MTPKTAELPKDLTDPVTAARRIVDEPSVLVSGPLMRKTMKQLLKVIDAIPARIADAVRMDRSLR